MKREWQMRAEQLKVWREANEPLSAAELRLIEAYDDFENAEFWKKWVYPEGANPEEIQNELMDYHEMLEEVSKVYMHVTMGRISKQNTHASAVIGEADDIAQRDIEEAVKEATEELRKELEELRGRKD